MATIKTLIGNVKGKDGGGYEQVILYDGNCSACINSDIITASSPMIQLSDSIEKYKSIRIEFISFDGKNNYGVISTSTTYSVNHIKNNYTFSCIKAYSSSNPNFYSAQGYGFYDDTHLTLCWENYAGWEHNTSHIIVTGIRDRVSDAEKNFNKYSTTEEVIGTWIDGKPLYRKCFNYTATTGEVIVADLSSLNIDTVCHMYGNFKDGNALIESIPFYLHSAYTVTPFYKLADKSLRLTANIANLTGTGVVIIEYTKTTS